MRSRFSHSGLAGLLAVLVLGALTGCGPQGNEGGSYARLRPQDQPAAGNTNLLASRTDALKRLEDDLTRSFDMFAPKSSVDAIPVPHLAPPRPVVANRSAQEEKQRRNSWLLRDPDELGKAQGLQDLFPSSAEQFGPGAEGTLDRLNNATALDRQRKDNSMGGTLGSSRNSNGLNRDEDSDLPGGVKEKAQALRKLLGIDGPAGPATAAEPRTSLTDIFGLNSRQLSEKDVADHKAYMDSYRQVLAGAAPAPVADPLNPFGNLAGPSRPAATYAPGLDPYTSSSLQGRNLYGASANPTLTGPTLPDVNARVLNQWNPLYTPPPAVEPPRATPPKPNFDAPKRKF